MIAEITQENLLLKKGPDLRGEKVTEIFKDIRPSVISAESTASFPVTRILRILVNTWDRTCLVLQAPRF